MENPISFAQAMLHALMLDGETTREFINQYKTLTDTDKAWYRSALTEAGYTIASYNGNVLSMTINGSPFIRQFAKPRRITMNFGEAQERFEETPTIATASEYMRAVLELATDDMIDDDALLNALADIQAFLHKLTTESVTANLVP